VQPGGPDGPTLNADAMTEAYTGPGYLADAGEYTGLWWTEGALEMAERAERRGFGQRAIRYALRDWAISLPLGEGTPIPIVHCDQCGAVPVPDHDLPVGSPAGGASAGPGKAPDGSMPECAGVACPRCGNTARRDSGAMDALIDRARRLGPGGESEPGRPAGRNTLAAAWEQTGVDAGDGAAMSRLVHLRFLARVCRDLGVTSPGSRPGDSGGRQGDGGC
jgi:leucyl-tRNA synthetase